MSLLDFEFSMESKKDQVLISEKDDLALIGIEKLPFIALRFEQFGRKLSEGRLLKPKMRVSGIIRGETMD